MGLARRDSVRRHGWVVPAGVPRVGGASGSETHQNSPASTGPPASLAPPTPPRPPARANAATRAPPTTTPRPPTDGPGDRRAGYCGTAGAAAPDLCCTLVGPVRRGFRTLAPDQQGGSKGRLRAVARRVRGRGARRRGRAIMAGPRARAVPRGREGPTPPRGPLTPPTRAGPRCDVSDLTRPVQRHRGPTRSGRSDLFPIASATRGGAPPRPASDPPLPSLLVVSARGRERPDWSDRPDPTRASRFLGHDFRTGEVGPLVGPRSDRHARDAPDPGSAGSAVRIAVRRASRPRCARGP